MLLSPAHQATVLYWPGESNPHRAPREMLVSLPAQAVCEGEEFTRCRPLRAGSSTATFIWGQGLTERPSGIYSCPSLPSLRGCLLHRASCFFLFFSSFFWIHSFPYFGHKSMPSKLSKKLQREGQESLPPPVQPPCIVSSACVLSGVTSRFEIRPAHKQKRPKMIARRERVRAQKRTS